MTVPEREWQEARMIGDPHDDCRDLCYGAISVYCTCGTHLRLDIEDDCCPHCGWEYRAEVTIWCRPPAEGEVASCRRA